MSYSAHSRSADGGRAPDGAEDSGRRRTGRTLADVGPADPEAWHGLDLAVDLAGRGRLRVPVAAAFGLDRAAAAHELSETRHATGKIVFRRRPGPGPDGVGQA